MDNEQHHNQPTTDTHFQSLNSAQSNSSKVIGSVEKTSAWVLILSAILFGLISIASIWGAFGSNNNASWRSLASLAVVALTAFVVNIGTRIYERRK